MDKPINVLLCEDSDHDILATQRAWKKFKISNPLYVVTNGEACLDFLLNEGDYSDPHVAPSISLLLLDLNMPRMGGIEVLKIIRDTPRIRHLKIVVLSTSQSGEDQEICYDNAVNAFVTKPIVFSEFAEMMNRINLFWTLVQPGKCQMSKRK